MVDFASWGWPQITYLIFVVLGWGITLAKHGEYRNDKYNFFLHFPWSLFFIFVLYKGGFF